MVDNFSASHQLFQDELLLLGAWRRFVEIIPFFFNQSLARKTSLVTRGIGPSPKTFVDLARKTLLVMHEIIQDVEVAQCELSQDFLRNETGKMASDLAGLILFFVDMGVGIDADSPHHFTADILLETLSLLTKTCESMFVILLSRSSHEVPSEDQIKVRKSFVFVAFRTLCLRHSPC